MKIDNLPEDEFVALWDETGNLVECRILGKTVYDGDEYAVCEAVSGEKAVLIADVRLLDGQQVPVGGALVEEVYRCFFSEHPELLPKENDTVDLEGEDGRIIHMEFLDLIEEQGKTYFIGIDADDETADEVIIFEVNEMEDMEEYFAVEDEELLEHLFEMFKERNPYYDYTEGDI